MSAVTEQATTQLASSIPNRASIISHDLVKRIITLEVMVGQSPGSSTITISAPPVTIPSGTWTLTWELVVTTPGLVVQFAPSGIVLSTESPLPPRVILSSPAAVSSQRWALQVQNDVGDVNALTYTIGIDWSSAASKQSRMIRAFHDPTIVVVKDPKDPPAHHQ